MPGARCTRSLVCNDKKAHERSHHGPPESPGIPRAMVLTASFVLSPVTGLFCHRRRQDASRRADASVGVSGPHDFAVRFSARRLQRRASTASRPAFVTIARAPLCWDGTAADIEVIWVFGKSEYFCKRGWTTISKIRKFDPTGKSVNACPIAEVSAGQAVGKVTDWKPDSNQAWRHCTRESLLGDTDLLADGSDEIADLFDGALQFFLRHPKMLCPAADGRWIIHGNMGAAAAILDSFKTNHERMSPSGA